MFNGRPAAMVLMLGGMLAGGTAVSLNGSGDTAQGAPEFLQPGHCYRIAFPIEGAPNYKVLERLDNGWVRGEVDAGPASAQRQFMWINTAQIITARETRCSD